MNQSTKTCSKSIKNKAGYSETKGVMVADADEQIHMREGRESLPLLPACNSFFSMILFLSHSFLPFYLVILVRTRQPSVSHLSVQLLGSERCLSSLSLLPGEAPGRVFSPLLHPQPLLHLLQPSFCVYSFPGMPWSSSLVVLISSIPGFPASLFT